ncbi:MAG: site-specific DNA-methyltransferase [Lachnospiraceae bacterium]|nr:site-specific DNA-methyltransferase [Lachnospiraceae bacterium]
MIKDIIEKNNDVNPGNREMQILREYFPACFQKDGSFDMKRFREYLNDKVTVSNEGYELRFLGKNYARMVASLDTTTVIVPDEEHNLKPENRDSENFYISGDNLDGLKHLLKSYARSVKCIYIDPPYNTGTDDFSYNDNFHFTTEELVIKLSISEEQAQRILNLTKSRSASHSAWLMYMYPRLVLARDLLSKDGFILISIDDNEQSQLQLLCDDIFGQENHLATIARRTKSGGGSAADAFAIEHDYICVYCKDEKEAGKLFMPFSEDYLKRYSEEDEFGRYFWDTMERSSTKTRPYCITAPDGTQLSGKWFRSQKRFEADLKKGDIRILRKQDGTWSVQFKQRLAKGKKMRSLLYENEFKSYSDDLNELGLGGTFTYPKTVYLIKYLLQLLNGGDTIIDFFSGSATTAQAVMEDNISRVKNGGEPNKYIMIQIPQNLDETVELRSGDARTVAENAIRVLDSVGRVHTLDQIGIERIIRAAKKIQTENPDLEIDLGFKHFTLSEPSASLIDEMYSFDPSDIMFTIQNNIMNQFGLSTVLVTWLERDGYGLATEPEVVNLAGYEAYYIDKHIYLLNQGLSVDAIDALIVKYETEGTFNPENVVIFGYNFLWTELENLQVNLKRLKNTDKNLRINFDVRY